MDRLPLEILQEVAALLDHRSLLQFSLVSKCCRDGAIPGIFREVVLKIPDLTAKDSASQVDLFTTEWMAILERSRSARYVRHVKIMSTRIVDPEDKKDRVWQGTILGNPEAHPECEPHSSLCHRAKHRDESHCRSLIIMKLSTLGFVLEGRAYSSSPGELSDMISNDLSPLLSSQWTVD